ncbi:MAG: DUF3343 domain-containing protein [Pelolinea sp.]|nr:DUF3343 domain-containing protein [Pelolinea sp.]
MEEFAVVLVESTNQAMRIEHLLNLSGVKSKLIPVPKFLSSSCGNCLKIDTADIDKVKFVVEKNKIQIDRIEIVQM